MSFNLQSVSDYGLGTMSLTWRPTPVDKSIAFAAIKRAIESNLPKKTFVNGGEFYGGDHLNLKYIQEFFKKYPELREKVVISIKGAIGPDLVPYHKKKDILGSIDTVLKYIPDLEIFEPARINPDGELKEIVEALDEAVDTKRIKGFTLSEVSAKTVEKVHELTKHQILGVEVEFSLFTRDIIENGIAETTGKLKIPIVAYSPLSRGFLTGSITSAKDIPEGDIRHHFERFNEENIAKNSRIVDQLTKLAQKKSVTVAQLSLAWVHYFSGNTVSGVEFPKIIPIPSSSSVERVDENFAKIKLEPQEFEEINSIIGASEVHGQRYNSHSTKFLSV